MDSGMKRKIGVFLAASLALVLILALEASPAAGAASKACRVINTATGQTYKRLQEAVDAASPGQRLTVKGICRGSTTIDKDLSVRGTGSASAARLTLDAGASGTVLMVRRVEVLLEDLTIEGGVALPWAKHEGRHYAGGITNRGGTLTLRDVVVRRNRGKDAGGIYNTGTLVLEGATRIIGNTDRGGGGISAGGITNKGTLTLEGASRVGNNGGGIANRGTLTLTGDSTVSSNGGLGVRNSVGTVTLNDTSSIRGSGACTGAVSDGATGLENGYGGTVTLNDTSAITGNWQGVYNDSSTLILNDGSRISRNCLGGVTNWSSISRVGFVVANGSARITGNGRYRGIDGGWPVAGVSNSGALTLNGQARVSRNRNWGVYIRGAGTLTMTGTSHITGNRGLGKRGGGVFKGTLIGVTCGPGGNVYGNTPDDCYFE